MWIEALGERLQAYGDVGGECLLIHGAGQSAAVFAPQLAAVPGAWAVDLPGHGASPGDGRASIGEYLDLVEEVIRRHARGAMVLTGHSMGGAIALEAGLRSPDLLTGLVLIGSGARLRVHPDLLQALSEGRFPDSFRRAMLRRGGDPKLLDRIPEPPDPKVRERDYLACHAFDALDRIAAIRLPTLVITGEEDAYTPEKYGRTLAQAMGGRFLPVLGAGHLVTLEHPDEVNRAIAAFLKEVLPA